MKNPLVSFAITCYNEELEWVIQCLDSIDSQTYRNFNAFLVIDRPDYPHEAALHAYAAQHSWLKVYTNPKNLGHAGAKNRANALTNGDYIAIVDADDYYHPQKLEIQIGYMEEHPYVDVCGTFGQKFGKKNKPMIYPIEHKDFYFYVSCCMAQPSVVLRRRVLDEVGKIYPITPCTEDYHAWVNLYPNYTFHNIPQVLYYYRVHPQQTSCRLLDLQDEHAIPPRRQALAYYLEMHGCSLEVPNPITPEFVECISNLDIFPPKQHAELMHGLVRSVPHFNVCHLFRFWKKGVLGKLSARDRRRTIWAAISGRPRVKY